MVELFIYSAIGADMSKDGVTASGVKADLDAADGADVLVRINSPGGNPFEGVAIKSLLDGYSGNVEIQVDGLAASAASIIALAGQRMTMADGAMLMIHDPWTITVGDEAEHRRTTRALGNIADNMAEMYAKKTDTDGPTMRELMVLETWLGADAAIDIGFADAKIDAAALACKVPAAFGYKHAPCPKTTETPENPAQLAAQIRQRKIDLTRQQMRA